MEGNVVILGGGQAGLTAARALAGEGFRVTLVERSSYAVFKPGLTMVAAGLRKPEELVISLGSLERLGVRLVRDEAVGLDLGERVVKLGRGAALGYDYLILALGGEPWSGGFDGLDSVNVNPWSLEGATRLAERLSTLPRGSRVVVGAFKPPYPCPPAPFELAGLLAAVGGNRFTVSMVFYEEEPLAKLGPEVSGGLKQLLDQLGVEFLGGFSLEGVSREGWLASDSHGRVDFDLLALVPPFRPPRLIGEAELAPQGSWPAVDPLRGFSHPRHDDVYIVGDLAMPSLGAPMSGFLASHSALAAAAAISGGEPPRRAYAECFIDVPGAGMAVYCDFTGVIYGGGGPHCHVIAEGSLAGEYKRGYERWWRSTVAVS